MIQQSDLDGNINYKEFVHMIISKGVKQIFINNIRTNNALNDNEDCWKNMTDQEKWEKLQKEKIKT